MERKEIKIQAPEGYEIDKENSTFECIKFKPINNPTYKDISNNLFNNDATEYYNTNCIGKIEKHLSKIDNHYGDVDFYFRKNNATHRKQLERVLALNQLLNIAVYYNRLHIKTDRCYNILFDIKLKCYRVSIASAWYKNSLTGIEAIFNRAEDAQEVIDNPNFREILDMVYKN